MCEPYGQMEKHWTTNGSGQHNIFLFVMNFIHSLCSNPISFQFNLSQYVFRRSKVWVCYVIRRDPYSGCIGCECVLSGNTPFNYSVTSRHNDSFCYVNTTGAQKNKRNRFVPKWNITLKCLWSLTKWHFVPPGLCEWAHNVAIGSNRQQSSTMCVCVRITATIFKWTRASNGNWLKTQNPRQLTHQGESTCMTLLDPIHYYYCYSVSRKTEI